LPHKYEAHSHKVDRNRSLHILRNLAATSRTGVVTGAKNTKRSAAYKGIGKGSPYSITERRVPELIPVLGSQPAGDVSHKPGGRLPLLSTRPAVTLATLKRAATSFAAWLTDVQWV